jgi:hypothetical protein
MKGSNVSNDCSSKDERKKIVKRKETVQGSVIYRESTSKGLDNEITNGRNGRKEVCNNCSTSEAHLTSRKNVTNEGCCHHGKKNHYP